MIPPWGPLSLPRGEQRRDRTSARNTNQVKAVALFLPRASLIAPILAILTFAAALTLTTTDAAAQPFGDPSGRVPVIQYVLDDVEINGLDKTSPDLVRSIIGLEAGERFGLFDLEIVKRRLLGTGYFLSVTPSLKKSQRRGHVLLVITVEERNTILLSDLFVGVSGDRGAWGGVDIVEGNLLGRGLTLGGAFVASRDQLATRLLLADTQAFALPLRLSGLAHYASGRESLFVADNTPLPPGRAEPLSLNFERLGGELGAGFYAAPLLGVFVDLGVETLQGRSDLPDLTDNLLDQGRSLHTSLRMTFDHDTRDSPYVPTSGYRLNLSIQGSSALMGSDYDYLKLVLRSALYKSLGITQAGHVLRFDLFGGIVLGQPPFFERFFVGDASALVPSRDLGLNFSAIGSPDFLHTGAGNLAFETVVAGLGLEYGVPIIEGPAPFYRVEFFVAAGLFGMTTPGDLPGDRRVNLAVDPVLDPNASVFPIDMTFNIGFKAETPIGIFGLSFANALALAPL